MFYVAFNKRSSVTAKAIQEVFTSKGVETRIINDKKFKRKPSVLLRWGNSYLQCPEGCIELNSLESVKLASNKLLMAYTLILAGVNFPKAFISPVQATAIQNLTGKDYIDSFGVMDNDMDLYYRNSANIVRRRNNYIQGDLYGTVPIDRAREFRVHIFNGRTIGVYEKIPHDQDQPYCKNENCDFVRIDTSQKEQTESIKGVRPEARKAVEALGLLFGGADVIISKTGEVFVNEVNSAPALNDPNILRYFDEIQKYLNNEQELKKAEVSEIQE